MLIINAKNQNHLIGCNQLCLINVLMMAVCRRSCVCRIPDYMTKNYPWSSHARQPFLSTRRSHGGQTGDLWMAVGAAYGPRRQHCLCCLGKIQINCIVACVTQTRHRGVCHGKGNAFKVRDLLICWWPLPQTSVSDTHAPFCDLELHEAHLYWQETCLQGSIWLMLPSRKIHKETLLKIANL